MPAQPLLNLRRPRDETDRLTAEPEHRGLTRSKLVRPAIALLNRPGRPRIDPDGRAGSANPSDQDGWLAELVAEHDAATAPPRTRSDEDSRALDGWLAELVAEHDAARRDPVDPEDATDVVASLSR